MSGFHFSSVPKFKIRCSRVVDDTSLTPPILRSVSALETTIRNVPKVMVDSPFPVLTVPEISSGVSLVSSPVGPVSSSETLEQLGKRKAAMGGGYKMALPSRSTEDGKKSQNVRRDKESRSSEAEDRVPKDRATSQAPTFPPVRRTQCINIGGCQGELDPTMLEKLPTAAAMAVTSVYRYWTPFFRKAVANADLTKLLKLAELHTSRGHVLNCELYKVLSMKIEELRSMRTCLAAQRKAELQLKSTQSIIHVKDKELNEALVELSKAKKLLASLGVPSYADPESSTGT
ncbi:hypothetical protein Adt_14603 [Abeliophyllum distichum]|uniref:Uncharacterized protein n=1 Tax=Abeliophyllum distichum TaxID=126358 RepID=A0ABD1U035_9LAMI